jgi:hypothetical protein
LIVFIIKNNNGLVNNQEIRFDSDGCAIAGTFTEAEAPVAAALLINGGGRLDRDSNARLPLQPPLRICIAKALAEVLAQARVSSLRYDKRGVGASGDVSYGTGMEQQFADARSAPAEEPGPGHGLVGRRDAHPGDEGQRALDQGLRRLRPRAGAVSHHRASAGDHLAI